MVESSLVTLYNFSQFENDPFFLSLLKKSEEETKYKYLTATEDTLNTITQCMFIIDQEEMIYKLNQNKAENRQPSFIKINRNVYETNLKKQFYDSNKKQIKKLLFNAKNQFKPGKQSPLFNIALTEDFKNNNINK